MTAVRVRELTVFIVRSSEEQRSESYMLNDVFRALSGIGLKPKTVRSLDTMPKSYSIQKSVFIMSPFTGKIFEKLTSERCRIVKPLLILDALRTPGGMIQNSDYPIHSYAMKGIVASTSGLDKNLKVKIQSKILMMGGRYSRNFVKGVTHLICSDGRTPKYKMAFRLAIPVMLPEWVQEIWDISSTEHINIEDMRLEKHRYGVFSNCVIASTGLTAELRESTRNSIQKEGGVFSYEFNNKCTHLVCHFAKGQKCDLAKQYHIPVLKLTWITDSIRSRYLLSYDLYTADVSDNSDKLQKPSHQHDESESSTLQYDTNTFKQLSGSTPAPSLTMDSSQVPSFFVDQSDVDVPTSTDAIIITPLSKHVIPSKIVKQIKEKIDYLCKDPFPLFEGFYFYFDELANLDELAETVITRCSGKRLHNLNSSITHILSGRTNLSKLDEVINKNYSLKHCRVLNLDWFKDTIDKRQIADIPFNEENSYDLRISALRGTWMESEEFETLLDIKDRENLFGALFENRHVLLLGFNKVTKVDLQTLVKNCKGSVSDDVNDRAKWDIVLSPLLIPSCSPVKADLFLTGKWIQACIARNMLLPPKSCVFYSPICQHDWTSKPLKRCCITVSGFTSSVKDGIVYIGKHLGAQMLDNLVKPTNKNGSTHLIIKEAKGSKYNAARTWKLPIVGFSWILACLTEERLPDVDEYSIENSSDESYAKIIDRIRQNRETIGIYVDDAMFDQTINSTFMPSQALSIGTVIPTQQSIDNSNSSISNIAAALIEDSCCDYSTLSPSRFAFSALTSSINPPAVLNSSNELMTTSDHSTSTIEPRQLRPFNFSTPINEFDNNQSSLSAIAGASSFFESSGNMQNIKNYEEIIKNLHSSNVESTESQSETTMDRLVHLLNDRLRTHGADTSSMDEQERQPLSQINSSEIKEPCLLGCRIAASKRLARYHVDYNRLATSMGAEFLPSYNQSCTHFIFQGKIRETSKEFKMAIGDGKNIVSPHWLYACRNSWSLVDEQMYPHCYDPGRKLNLRTSHSNTQNDTQSNMISLSFAAELISAELDDATNLEPPLLLGNSGATTGTGIGDYDIELDNVECENLEEQQPKVQWVDDDADVIRAQMSKPRVFCFTGLKTFKTQRSSLEESIKALGAKLSTTNFTHLITESITRGERFLTAMAKSGCWILQPEYVVACENAGHFVDEELFEWCADRAVNTALSGVDLTSCLCAAARKWRLEHEPAFSHWKSVLLVIPPMITGNSFEQRLNSLARTLIAGGVDDVQVWKSSEGMPSISDQCIVFVDERSLTANDRRLWLEHCNNKNVFRLEYIAALLIEFDKSQTKLIEEYSIKCLDRQPSNVSSESRKRKTTRNHSHPTRKK
ncbi:hypothetical protein GJ496_007515 [Pomphorhynchus laevis]|nr:hypothetical protein GJ496_007515 [Pomphorhynchus laevis]